MRRRGKRGGITGYVRPEEKRAADSLKAILLTHGHSEVCVVPVSPGNDPPDFYCKVDGERWAVEVTHSNQQVSARSARKARTEIDNALMRFGKSLGKKTESFRQGQYLLMLRWPPSGTPWTKWRKQISAEVSEFVRSGEIGERTLSEICGSSIHSTTSGSDWLIAVAPADDAKTPGGALLCDIAASVYEMIAYALADKAPKTNPVTGTSKNVLFLINTYFFGDDSLEVRRCITDIFCNCPYLDIFDHVFYEDDGKVSLVYSRS